MFVLFNVQIGRPAFDVFLKKYIATFKFQSIDTDTFIDFLKANIPGIEEHIDLELWVEGTGIPPDAMEPVSNIYSKIVSLANEFQLGRMPKEDEVADWHGQEWELYLENLPKSVEASQVLSCLLNYCIINYWDNLYFTLPSPSVENSLRYTSLFRPFFFF